ncbi:MAG TPA: tRNA uridine-5-carboxymethylaminomethyl(34) synthesis GTPase MnmE [Saprospiraceae bacterium]|nr:tRNA uridine-5-carboxymethylaminomethyl(34) synthesis GTPase MnmE [Saprospiraceae bacterium]HMP25624.1 tRNA uridine-5-carboxymethylaminomethyl(34) synthesis GTPase MnmE [Saprospiraceae bacterium]
MYHSTQTLNDTIVALATPPGTGAIGVIRLSGMDAIRIANTVFHGKDLAQQASHTVHFGTIRNGEQLLDEVLVTLFIAPKSYTGEDVVEVSCHGSTYIIQQVIHLLLQKGARLAQPGEFTLRAFLNGRMDLSQAEAVADLIAAESESAHTVAMQQMRGGFANEIKRLREDLIHFASMIELELDFGEEDVTFANRDDLRQLIMKIRHIIYNLIISFQLGNVIKNGVSTVIAGRPNAGKSTLLNALLNEERAIVSDIAGTTRDTIEEVLNIKGVQFRLIDTAGIREAQDQIEAIGVQKTMEKIQQSALLIYVFDIIKTPPEAVHQDISKLLHPGIQLLVVANKMDLNPYTKWEHYAAAPITQDNFVPISAINQMNIEFLKEKLYEAALSGKTTLESTIVTNARHYAALQGADERLQAVLQGLEQGITGDFLALDIRRALAYLGEITGEVGVEDLLENIFSRFCIGK